MDTGITNRISDRIPGLLPFAMAAVGLLAQAAQASSITTIWLNAAGRGGAFLEEINIHDGSIVQNFWGPNPEARGFVGGDAGRGIEVIGTTIYYTTSGSGKVFITDTRTHADLGYAFETGLRGLRALSWDGEALWMTSEFFRGAYRYSLDGKFLGSSTTVKRTDWINKALGELDWTASDETYRYSSGVEGNTALGVRALDGSHGWSVDMEPQDNVVMRHTADLSVVHAAVPEPGALSLMALGLIALGTAARFSNRRRSRDT